jgi:hypothetical protein
VEFAVAGNKDRHERTVRRPAVTMGPSGRIRSARSASRLGAYEGHNRLCKMGLANITVRSEDTIFQIDNVVASSKNINCLPSPLTFLEDIKMVEMHLRECRPGCSISSSMTGSTFAVTSALRRSPRKPCLRCHIANN